MGCCFLPAKSGKKNRKFGEATFRHLGIGKRSFETSVQEEAKILVRLIEENTKTTRQLQKDVLKAVANVICRVICGRRFEYTDELFIRSTDTVNSDPWNAMLFKLSMLLPWTRFLPPVRAMLELILAQRKDMALQYLDVVEKHKSTLDPNNVRDFIDAFLVEQQQEKEETGENQHFCMPQLTNLIREIFIAGTDTSSNTVLWCFLGLLHFPEWQQKIQSEIKNVICEDMPSLSHRDSMPITQAYIQEIQRYCTLAPLAIPHCAAEDAAIYGYSIPKGTQVMINLWSVHNDPEYFDNPKEFSPDRFLDANGNFIRSNHVIPFIVGPRHCRGEQLAKMEIFLFLTFILQKFTIKEDTELGYCLPALDDGVIGALYVPKPFDAMFIPVQ